MDRNFYELYLRMEKEYAEKAAVCWVGEDGKTVCTRTYGEFCADIRRFAAYLKDRIGDPAGKHAAVLARTRYEYFVVYYAAFLTKCVIIPLNYQKDLNEILDEMQRADVTAVIYDGDGLKWHPELPGKFGGQMIDICGYTEYQDSEIENAADPDALAVIMYTSGTTGRSKGVMMTQKNLLVSFIQRLALERELFYELNLKHDAFMVILPMFHVSGLSSFENFTLGYTVNLCPNPKYFYRDIALMRTTHTTLVPVLFKSIVQDLKNKHRDRLGALDLLVTAGASADTEALMFLIENGYSIRQVYGMTESSTVGIYNYSQELANIKSLGKKETAIQIKLIDGEICFKGDTVFAGYYNDPEETAAVFDEDGWFHTGDLGRVDENGYYYLTGRKKNLIILASGENVSPEELEGRLLENADITEAVVKEKNGKIAAEIYCGEAKRQEIEAFVTELNRTLPSYKFIAEVEFRDTPFERTATGKIKR